MNADQLAAIEARANVIQRCMDAAPNDCYDMSDIGAALDAADDDVPTLLALVREQAAKLDALEDLASGWKPPRSTDLRDTQVWYSFAKHHAAQAIRNIVRGL